MGATASSPSSSKRHVFVLLGLLLVTGLADWLTSYEISVGPLYLLAVFHAAWHFGWRWGAVVAVTVSLFWLLTDIGTGHVYSRDWMRWQQFTVRLTVHGCIAIAVGIHRQALEAHRKRLAVLERVLLVCPACGKIGPREGGWVHAEDFMRESSERYRFCPSCSAVNSSAHGAPHSARSEVA